MNNPISEISNEDCMEMMKRFPDKYFDLAIVDPPYGIGKRLTSGGGTLSSGWANMVKSNADAWDIAPNSDYFDQLFRVSKNQIIWGGNFFDLPPCYQPICWDKVRPNQKNVSEWEYAQTSFTGRARLFSFCNNGGFLLKSPRIHPTQKPTELYDWLLNTFAKTGEKILDTHLGSGSSRISAYKNGFDFWGCEIDKDYFEDSKNRFNEYFKFQIKNDNNFF